MAWWRRIVGGTRALLDRQSAEADIADEVDHFFAEAVASRIAAGLDPAEARRQTRLELGDRAAACEAVRGAGWEHHVDTLIGDLRHGVRRLYRQPGFTTVAVLTLALGIGASTAIFSAVHPVVFEALPYPQPSRVTMIWDRGIDGRRTDVTFGTYREVEARARSFEALAVVRAWQPTLTGEGDAERLDGQSVTADWFRVFGIAPAWGRDFEAFDDVPGAPPVVILADELWRRRFGGDSAVVGRRLLLDGVAHTVIGVMPRGFENVLAPEGGIWRPLRYDASLPPDGREWGHHLRMLGRLRADVSPEVARNELTAIAGGPVQEFARPTWAALDRGLILNRLQFELTRDVRPALLALVAAVALLLATACANVTSLLLARIAQRRGEFAVRAVLGAGRTRLARQMVVESLLLALPGGLVGIAVAAVGVYAIVALAPDGLPRVDAIALDGTAHAFAFGVTTVTGILIGLVPALRDARRDLRPDVQQMAQRTTPERATARSILVVAQVALALVLLIGAGLLLRSFQRLLAVDPGFDATRTLTMQIQTAGPRFDDDAASHAFFADVLHAVGRLPGVDAAALTSQLPLTGDFDVYGVRLEPSAMPDAGAIEVFRYAVSPDYFHAMDIPLLHGRLFEESDVAANADRTVLVSASFARRYFPGRDPVGRHLQVGRTDLPPHRVVGVVGDVRQTSLAIDPSDAVYIPAPQWYFADRARWLIVRAAGDPLALTPAVRRAIASVDRDQPVLRIATMRERLAASTAERRFILIIFQAFACAALALAAIGVYGLLAASVTERTREIGVRSALGARRGSIVALVVRHALVLTAIGIGIGLLAALAGTRVLGTLLFDVSPRDILTWSATTALVLAIALLACAAPAWRAAGIDPGRTLREG